MLRNIVHINEDKCDGCGLCVSACHEGAIGLINGKAHLLRDDYCDGLGDCLPACPADAITIVQREAPAYDEAAVIRAIMDRAKAESHASMPAQGCPSSQAKRIERAPFEASNPQQTTQNEALSERVSQDAMDSPSKPTPSRLSQWPVQIKLAPTKAEYFNHADLLIAADCCAFAYGNFHEDYIKGRICLIGCPKLDGVNYSEKLTEICMQNSIHSVVVCRMEVPCCGGIEVAASSAVETANAQKQPDKDVISLSVVTIATDGSIL